MNRFDIYLSPLASKKLTEIIAYLKENWSDETANKFIKKFREKIIQITEYPNSCPQSHELEGLFKLVIEKHTSLYYRINNRDIEIITVIDNRQNPKTIIDEIKNQNKQ